MSTGKNSDKIKNKYVLDSLKTNGISSEDILLACPVDLSDQGEYITGYAFLTEDRIGTCTGRLPDGYVQYFKGVKYQDLPDDDIRDYKVNVYEIAKLSHIHLEHFIGTNILTAYYEDHPIQLAEVTNRYLERMTFFVNQLKALKNGGEVKEEPEAEEEESVEDKKSRNKSSIFFRTLKYFLKYLRGIVRCLNHTLYSLCQKRDRCQCHFGCLYPNWPNHGYDFGHY